MTAYESMSSKLLQTGLYGIEQGGAVDCELKAYAVELDRIYTELDVLLREAFVPTAQTYGISGREKFIGKERSDLTLARRRELLMLRETRASGGHGSADLNQLIEALGVTDYSVTIVQRHCKITITVNDSLTAEQKADFEKSVKAFTPVTFETIFEYNT